ncbi:hypothetical protein K501DRAFT_288480 [Backusella circina FSU 941]|nr:hypothetical protein K501DRAFT_288480 [Backusella circina FSU 941]
MNYKIPQDQQEEGSNHQEGTEHIHSFTDSQPSSTTPSSLPTTPMAQNNFHASLTDQLHYQPYVPSQSSSSSASSSLIYNIPTSIDMSPGYYASAAIVSPSSPSNTGYFTSSNGIIHSSVTTQFHYTNPNFEYSNYVPQQQTPPLPLPIQRIASHQGQPGRKRRSGRTAASSASPPTPLSSSDQEQQQSQNKRRKRRHDLPGPAAGSSEITGNSVSPHSNVVTPLPSPILYHQKEKTLTEVTVVGVGGGRDIKKLEYKKIKEEHLEESTRDINEQQSLSRSQSPLSQRSQSPSQPQQVQQQQRSVKSIETQISFLKDECATILMMLGSLRTAFLADETNKQQEQENVNNKKKDRKLAMEREMRIAYDDLMLQVRQLERKVERLEERSRLICGRG